MHTQVPLILIIRPLTTSETPSETPRQSEANPPNIEEKPITEGEEMFYDMFDLNHQMPEPSFAPTPRHDNQTDAFDTLIGLTEKGDLYMKLVKCPVPGCGKMGPPYSLNNHYMMAHANKNFVHEHHFESL